MYTMYMCITKTRCNSVNRQTSKPTTYPMLSCFERKTKLMTGLHLEIHTTEGGPNQIKNQKGGKSIVFCTASLMGQD